MKQIGSYRRQILAVLAGPVTVSSADQCEIAVSLKYDDGELGILELSVVFALICAHHDNVTIRRLPCETSRRRL
jgi:hypothetical protein